MGGYSTIWLARALPPGGRLITLEADPKHADVARANLLALTAGDGNAYCIGSGKGTSVNSLYRGLVNEIGHEVMICQAPKRPGDIYLTYFDNGKALRELGWKAEVRLEQGLRLTVSYFRDALGMGSARLQEEPLRPLMDNVHPLGAGN